MNNSVFPFITTCKVDQAIADEFQKWMETDHIPKMHKTGCFVEGQSTRMITIDAFPGFNMLTYNHLVLATEKFDSADMWRIYSEAHRPSLKAEFMEKFGKALESGQIMILQNAGYENVIF